MELFIKYPTLTFQNKMEWQRKKIDTFWNSLVHFFIGKFQNSFGGFWRDVVLIACFLINRVPSNVLSSLKGQPLMHNLSLPYALPLPIILVFEPVTSQV